MTAATNLERGRGSNAGYGVGAMVAATLVVTGNDTLAKLLTQTIPVSQFVTLRGGSVLLGLALCIVVLRQFSALRIRNRPVMLMRCLSMVGATWLFLQAVQLMPLVDVFALFFTAPLISTLLGHFFMKERVGWRRWTAVLVGLVGVAVALMPGGQTYPWWAALLPLTGAFFSATRDISSRRLTDGDASMGILFYTVVAVFLSGLIGAGAQTWVPISWSEAGLVLACAFMQASAHYLQIEAYRHAEISLLAPFRYLALIFGAIAGYLAFGDLPTWNLWAGSGIIVACGLFVGYRERTKARRMA